MIDKFEWLCDKTSHIDHSGSTFYNHLYNTGKILYLMGEHEYICDAGLYHSIYDTSYFKANLNIDRDTVRNIIGVKAESLVFSFCSLQNRSFVLINSNFDNKQNHINLLKIEYANLIEQNHTRQCNEQIKLIRERFVRLENEY